MVARGLVANDLQEMSEIKIIMTSVQATIQQARADQSDKYERYLDLPLIHMLFPFIKFARDERAKLLVTTVQKGFQRFFDGKTSTNLSSLRDTEYIIFLDEFDFLEGDLIDIACGSAQVERPFAFVEHFTRNLRAHLKKSGGKVVEHLGSENRR